MASKVLHIIKALGRGGAEVLLAEGLGAADRDRFAYSYGYLQTLPDDVAEDLRRQGAQVHCFRLDGKLKMMLGARRIAEYLREQNIELVHAHLPIAGAIARLAGRLASVPVIYTEHSLIERYHPVARRLNLLTWPWQEQVIAISDDVAASIQRHAGRRIPVRTIWNGVNTSTFAPCRFGKKDVRGRFGIPADSPLVGTVAVLRDTPAKRLDVWLEGARAIHAAEPETHFLLVGDGPVRSELEARAREFGLANVVHFAGRQSDVRPFLAAMDIFLMSSAYEGFGIALVEAMAMEVAVVATNVAGVRNIVTSGETGLLAEFDEDVARVLGELCLELIRNPGRRKHLAIAGRGAAVEKFSIQRMQWELEALYEHVLGRPAQAASMA